jgi:hypothetical protein
LYFHNTSNYAAWWINIGDTFRTNEATGEKELVPHTGDLIFSSVNGSGFAMTDNFEPNIINFTGQHRCTSKIRIQNNFKDFIGKIVVSTGEYSDLDNVKKISINESIPIIDLARKANDKRAFGVISGMEDDLPYRDFQLGYLRFTIKKKKRCKKVTVNSLGEGGIWICDIGGNFENGDLITSSEIPGYGMLQDSSFVTCSTVAKITCNCSFDLNSKVYECFQEIWKGKLIKKAFVGCIYKC